MTLAEQEKRQQAIRLSNTLLAFAGGFALSLIVVYAHLSGYSTVKDSFIVVSQAVFWTVNFLFVGLIYSNLNIKLKFADPSLSIHQMYWASTTSVIYLCALRDFYEAIYFMLFLSQVFGAFRLDTKEFIVYCTYVVFAFALGMFFQHAYINIDRSLTDTLVTCIIFAFCSFALVRMCISLLKLKLRLKEKNA